MQRREFITLLGGAAAMSSSIWPLAARAQQPGRIRRIGFLMAYAESDSAGQSFVAAFRDELQKLGWAQGQNVRFDYGWAGADVDAMRRAAMDLIALQPDVIVSSGTPGTAVLLQQTRTIPVIFANLIDPIGAGFVVSMPRPGGNATGFTNLDPQMAGKWMQLLKEVAPRTERVVIPYNPETAPYADLYLPYFKAAAAALGVEAIPAKVRDMAEFETVVAAHAREPNGGLIPMPDAFAITNRTAITSMAARHRLPAAYHNRTFPQVGGLLSYGNDIFDNFRHAAGYADRILKGTKPSDLPVQFPTKFELVINNKTANALGLELHSSLLLARRRDHRLMPRGRRLSKMSLDPSRSIP